MKGSLVTRIAAAAIMAAIGITGVFAQAPPTVAPAASAQTPATPSAYRLNAGDGIEVKFFQNPELNELVQIRPDGRISMTAIGEMGVEGLTIAELVSRLEAAYARILKQPSVTVQVRTFANSRILVGGEVARPGALPLIGQQTALGAITEAGGWKPSSKRNEILVIRRRADNQPELLRLSTTVRNAQPSQAALFMLQPLDIVLVPESGISRANRAVDQYVRQMIPFVITAGFTYVVNGALIGVN